MNCFNRLISGSSLMRVKILFLNAIMVSPLSKGIFSYILPPGNWQIASAKSWLGECLVGQKKYAEAEPLLLEGYSGMKYALGETHPRTVRALKRIITLYEEWQKHAPAAQFRALLPPLP